MRTYQTVVIVKSDLEEMAVNNFNEKIKQFITKYSGSLLKLEIWGKKRLAYRIRKNRHGFYINFCHTLDPMSVPSFEKELRLDEGILKYLVIRLESSEIERICAEPQVLEKEGAKNIDEKNEVFTEESG